MARQSVNLGEPITGVGGDKYRTAHEKINANFLELYTSVNSFAATATKSFESVETMLSAESLSNNDIGDVVTAYSFNGKHIMSKWLVVSQASSSDNDFVLPGGKGLYFKHIPKSNFVDLAEFGFNHSVNADNALLDKFIRYCGAKNLIAVISGDLKSITGIVIRHNLDLLIFGTITLAEGIRTGITTEQVLRGSAPLTSNANRGQNSVYTANAIAGAVKNDIALIHSTRIFDPRTNTKYGEGCTVSSTSTSSVVLAMPLVLDYATADSASINVYKSYQVNISGRYTIVGDGNTTQLGIDLINCIGSSINDSKTDRVNAVGVRFTDSINCSISNAIADSSAYYNQGYAASVMGACKNIKIDQLHATRCRHAFTTNTRGTGLGGLPINVVVTDSTCARTVSAGDGFDTHAAALDIWFVRCKSIGSSSIGFNFESASGGMIDCSSDLSANAGYRIRNETFYNKGSFTMTGCQESESGSHGFSIGSKNSPDAVPFRRFSCDNLSSFKANGSGVWFREGLANFVELGFIAAYEQTGSYPVLLETQNIVQKHTGLGFSKIEKIVDGKITFNTANVILVPETGEYDELTTIQGGSAGEMILLKLSANSHDIKLVNAVGNIKIGRDITLDISRESIALYCDGTSWLPFNDATAPIVGSANIASGEIGIAFNTALVIVGATAPDTILTKINGLNIGERCSIRKGTTSPAITIKKNTAINTKSGADVVLDDSGKLWTFMRISPNQVSEV